MILRFLKVEKFSGDLICGEKLFCIFGPSAFKLSSPNFTWLVFRVSRVRTCCLRAALFENNDLKILDIDSGLADSVFSGFLYITTEVCDLPVSFYLIFEGVQNLYSSIVEQSNIVVKFAYFQFFVTTLFCKSTTLIERN